MREGAVEPSHHGCESEDQWVSSWKEERHSFNLGLEQKGILRQTPEAEKRVPEANGIL